MDNYVVKIPVEVSKEGDDNDKVTLTYIEMTVYPEIVVTVDNDSGHPYR